MLFLLRNIRKKLMSQNKFTTYFLYAIGEVLLVVVGILIAVRIDAWSEYQKEREQEAFIISEINREMKENLIRFDSVQSNILRTVEAGNRLVELFPFSPEFFKDQESYNKFSVLFPEFLYNASYDPSNGSITSVINSGNINLIQDVELRTLIVNWQDLLNDYKEEELVAWKYGYQFMDWLTENFQNPQYTEPDFSSINYRAFQGKIGQKLSLYNYAYDGTEKKALEFHIKRMIELTSNKSPNAVSTPED